MQLNIHTNIMIVKLAPQHRATTAMVDNESDPSTANLRTKILDSRGFDSSRVSILRGGIIMSIGNFPECLSQAILVGIILVGRLGVSRQPGSGHRRATYACFVCSPLSHRRLVRSGGACARRVVRHAAMGCCTRRGAFASRCLTRKGG